MEPISIQQGNMEAISIQLGDDMKPISIQLGDVWPFS
jgi:hypothetical protein